MEAFYSLCHMCGAHNYSVLTPAYLPNGDFCSIQKIVICKDCGLVYKNPVIPKINNFSYTPSSWGDGEIFKNEAAVLSSYLSSFNELSPGVIAELGPGPGWLAMSLKQHYPDANYIMFEISEDLASIAKKNVPDALVFPFSIDDVKLDPEFVDLAIVSGVDYLFNDFLSSIRKIHRTLCRDGYIYISRNVFVEAEAYIGQPINSYKDLFGSNLLMTTWFSVSQYRSFLSHFFDIISERSIVYSETEGCKSIAYAYLCKKRTPSSNYVPCSESWYEENTESLRRLS